MMGQTWVQGMDELLAESQRATGLGSWEWDASTNEVLWSDELYRVFGCEPRAFSPTLQGYLERVLPEDRPRVRGAIEAALREGSSFDHRERVLREDGRVRVLHSRGRVMRDVEGRAARMVGTCQDVTELQETEEALGRAQARLAEALPPSEDRVTRLEERVGGGFERLVGKSEPMREVYRKLRLAARSDVTVLLTGESGTGKELAALAIHARSARASKPFVAVNCSAIPETLLESELFGHVKGAFTGAIRDRAGLFQEADGGTLFLDEIGDMSPALQVKVLRGLQEREVRRVGGDKATQVDVRVLAATHRDLAALVAEGKIREDFYYRVNVFDIPLPPLRERRGDIPLLVRHFLGEGTINGEAMRVLMNHDWPGNVRELRNAMEHAGVTAAGGTITAAHLPASLRKPAAAGLAPEERSERERVRQALAASGWNRTQAAARLGISRVTVWKKIRRFGLAPDGR
jgi:two-component system, NtrC family, response regulator HydG